MSDATDSPPVKTTSDDGPPIKYESSRIAKQWKHDAPLLGCRYDPTGRFVFASSMDHSIQRWDLQEDQHVSFVGHKTWLRALGFSPDGKAMYSGGYEGLCCVWDATATPDRDTAMIAPRHQWAAHQGWIRALDVHADGHLMATGGNDLVVKLWSPETGDQVGELKGHEKHIYSLLFHPTKPWLLSGDLAGVVHVWDLEKQTLLRSFDAKPLHTYHGGQQVDYGGVRCMALSSDQTELACGGLHKATNPFAGVQEPLVVVFDWESGKQTRTHEANAIPRGIVWRLLFQPDETLIGGIGGDIGAITFWKDDLKEFHKLALPSPAVDLDRHRNQRELVAACHDGTIRVIEMFESES